MVLNLSKVIELIVKEKGLRQEDLVQVVEAAVQSAAKKVYGDYDNIEAHYNPELDEVEVFQFKVVTEDVEDTNIEIPLKQARKLDPNCQIGDELGEKLDASKLGRIAAQSAKQVIVQKVKEVERDAIYNDFIDVKGEIVSGFIHRFDRKDVIVNLGKAEAILGKGADPRRDSPERRSGPGSRPGRDQIPQDAPGGAHQDPPPISAEAVRDGGSRGGRGNRRDRRGGEGARYPYKDCRAIS